jgi:hypothetical protein
VKQGEIDALETHYLGYSTPNNPSTSVYAGRTLWGNIDMFRVQKCLFNIYIDNLTGQPTSTPRIMNMPFEFNEDFNFINQYKISAIEHTSLLNTSHSYNAYIYNTELNITYPSGSQEPKLNGYSIPVLKINNETPGDNYKPWVNITLQYGNSNSYINIPTYAFNSVGMTRYNITSFDAFYGSSNNLPQGVFSPVYYFQPLTSVKYDTSNPFPATTPGYISENIISKDLITLQSGTSYERELRSVNSSHCDYVRGMTEQVAIGYIPGYDANTAPTRYIGDIRIFEDGISAYDNVGLAAGASLNANNMETIEYEQGTNVLPDQH